MGTSHNEFRKSAEGGSETEAKQEREVRLRRNMA